MLWKTAIYCRLSREDGDKKESDSIKSQQNLLCDHIEQEADLTLVDQYFDDGYTGTNFNRPAFLRLWADIERGRINCVLVKDLSRFGRDYIEVGRYLERIFPKMGVRFIALGDQIDSGKAAYDLLLPLKNIFNQQYAKDISQKVKSALKTKQKRGDFIGAFACYGYQKNPQNRNQLDIDPVAAQVVERIFSLYESGLGKLAIAKMLNRETVACPSLYKEQCGTRYSNGNRLPSTGYWTYTTIHRMLKNPMYAGHMTQGRSERKGVQGKAESLPASRWIVVENTHAPIVAEDCWARVQALLARESRAVDFSNVSPFAGFLHCGDCGRAMSKTSRGGKISYSCGSYKRYGKEACSPHTIQQGVLESLLLEDINALIAEETLPALVELVLDEEKRPVRDVARKKQLSAQLARIERLKKRAYEDFAEGILEREDYLQYKESYQRQVVQLQEQLEEQGEGDLLSPWLCQLAERGQLWALDRLTMAELFSDIRIFDDGRIVIAYRWGLGADYSCSGAEKALY